ncbi:hypothetical protein GZH46_00176 [Fragariocoptes setiger]|uniref:Uncharacterized protein n=1 Tax=Fragariocoptes setiger TaxID=1670756 RepID=A0ABQ7SCW9_9ACAR|nr:hypothetical protein GZH46_00176 [Fragariocoptes setiger]
MNVLAIDSQNVDSNSDHTKLKALHCYLFPHRCTAKTQTSTSATSMNDSLIIKSKSKLKSLHKLNQTAMYSDNKKYRRKHTTDSFGYPHI